jgi:hypothetical protein
MQRFASLTIAIAPLFYGALDVAWCRPGGFLVKV